MRTTMDRVLVAAVLAVVVLTVSGLWTVAANAATIAANRVNCRAAPRTTAIVLSVLRRGEEVARLSSRADWAYVDPANDPACWVQARFLVEDAAVPSLAHDPERHRPTSHRITTAGFQPTHLLATSRQRASVHATRHRVSAKRHTSVSRAGHYSYANYRRRSSARMSVFSSGSCPCGSGNICIGPPWRPLLHHQWRQQAVWDVVRLNSHIRYG